MNGKDRQKAKPVRWSEADNAVAFVKVPESLFTALQKASLQSIGNMKIAPSSDNVKNLQTSIAANSMHITTDDAYNTRARQQ